MNPLIYLLEKYPEKPWDWGWIPKNTFNWKKKREKAVLKIQKVWHDYWWKPYYDKDLDQWVSRKALKDFEKL